jgi:MOSC domain-containing protein YiiM
VLQTGMVSAGDTFSVVPGAREVTIEELFRMTTRKKMHLF